MANPKAKKVKAVSYRQLKPARPALAALIQGCADTVASNGMCFLEQYSAPRIILSSMLGFPGMVIAFDEVAMPTSMKEMVSFVGHPATRALVEALGATTDVSNNGAPGRYAGPAIGESYLAVPLANNQRPGGMTADVAISDVAQLRAVICTRIA